MARKSYQWCEKCKSEKRSGLVDLAKPCQHIMGEECSCSGAPAVLTFRPYWDEHISTDGKPVFLHDARQKRELMRSQWQGDFQQRLIEREFINLKRRSERIKDEHASRK